MLTKLVETLADKGIGSLLRPWQIRREGRADIDVKREAILRLAEAEKEAQDILAGKKVVVLTSSGQYKALPAPSRVEHSEKVITDKNAAQFLLTDAARQFAGRELQRNVNLHRIALHAEEQAQSVADEEVSKEPVDPDWLNRWRENAQDVSDEYMQKVWARILTDEVKSPGRYSMATLEFLRTLSKSDAHKIAAIGPFAIDYAWIHNDERYLKEKGLTLDAVLDLQEMGILSGAESIGFSRVIFSVHAAKFIAVAASNGKALYIEHEKKERPLEVPMYRITKLGAEVLRLGDYEPVEDYLKLLAAAIKGKGFKVHYGDWKLNPKNPKEGRLTNSIEL